MIERKFVSEKLKEFMIGEHVNDKLKHAGQSEIKLKKTPLGEKLIITASRPGLVVGRKGENIKILTSDLKKKFKLDNPQIEIEEVENQFMDSRIMADKIAMTLERFGAARFKSIGYRVLTDIMNAGALGAEILISGKIPSSRAKTWRFYQGYLKKSGSVAVDGVLTSYTIAKLKTGVVGIQVRIMPANLVLPDKIDFKEAPVLEVVEDKKIKSEKEKTEDSEKEETKEKSTKKKATKKKVAKKTTKKKVAKKESEDELEKVEETLEEAKKEIAEVEKVEEVEEKVEKPVEEAEEVKE